MDSNILIESKSLRESVISKVDVLDKIKKLSMLPGDVNTSVSLVSDFYEVDSEVIKKVIQNNRKELESDGLKILKSQSAELRELKSLGVVPKNAAWFTIIPKRAVLRIGMLLRDSVVAQEVRNYLLDMEQQKQPQNIIQIPTELNMIGQLLEVSNQSFRAMLQMQGQIEAADKKADEANKKAAEIEAKNKELESELNDVRNGLVDVNIPLRTQFNDAVRKYAKRHNLEWEDAYNNVYGTLSKQNHVDLKRRLQNRQENGDKVKMIDIVEELNLLVPAIRLAKTLAGVAS